MTESERQSLLKCSRLLTNNGHHQAAEAIYKAVRKDFKNTNTSTEATK
jgi:hypothetical protein